MVVIQLVPYGRDHSNPEIVVEPAWDSPRTRQLVKRACFDCHSNETVWPWYSNIAPVSWLIQQDVDEGRESLNFSEWSLPQKEAKDAAESVRDSEMPPLIYGALRPKGRLTPLEREALIRGLQATLGEPDRDGKIRDPETTADKSRRED